MADIEIRYGKRPTMVRFSEINEFHPGELQRRELEAT